MGRSVRHSAGVATRIEQAQTAVDAGRQLKLFEQAPAAAEQRAPRQLVRADRARGANGRRAGLTLGGAARIIREAVKDKSYRETPLGQLVGRYLRWFRNEYGGTESTIRDYEAILARMSLLLADREPLEVSTEDLRDVIDTRAMRHARTRAKVTSVIRTFWVWAEEEGHVPFSPASKIRRPRAPRKTAPLLPAHVDELLLDCARTSRDRLALLVLLDCGVRRAELGGIRIRDFDLACQQLIVFGKGQKERVIPLRGRIVMALRAYLGEPLEFVGRRPEARRLPPLPGEAHAGPARLLGRLEEVMRSQHRAPLVVPNARAGGPRRPRRPLGPQHAPRPAHVRDRAAPRRRRRGRLAGARAQRPLDDPRHLRPPGSARPRARHGGLRRGTRGRGSREPGERFALPARLNPAICRSDGGGGNRTRVRGRTGRASTSVVRACASPGGRFADDLPAG